MNDHPTIRRLLDDEEFQVLIREIRSFNPLISPFELAEAAEVTASSLAELNGRYFIEKAKAEAIEEFAKEIRAEIDKAIKSNQQAKKQRIDRLNEKGIVYIDNVCSCCDGKIHALCGIGEFIDNLVKEKIGEQKYV